MQLPNAPPAWRAMSRYASAVRWLGRALWEAFRWRVVGTIAAAQLGVLVVGAGVSLSFGYLRQLEADGDLRLGSLVLTARDGTTLTLMVAATLVTLLAGAGILFLAQRRIVGMAAELNHHVRMRIALAYGGELPPPDWRDERSVQRALWVLETRDARRTAIVARSLLRNTVNLAVVLVGTAALFYLDAVVTVLFLMVVAIAMIAYYRTNATSARATRRYETVAPTTRRALRRLVPSVQTLARPSPERAELEAALDPAAVTEETQAFRDRFGAHIHSELLGFAIMGVALAGLTAYMGRQALAGTIPWTHLVAYVLVLRFTLNGIQSVLRTFAFFSRFYPAIDRLNRFLSASSSTTTQGPLATLTPRFGAQAVTEDADVARPIRAGEVVEVVLPVPLSRYSLGLLAPAFVGAAHAERRHLLGQVALALPPALPATGASLHNLVNLNGAGDTQQLRDRLGEHATTIEAAVGLDPSGVVSADAWARVPNEAMQRLVLTCAAASGRPVLAVDRSLADGGELARLAREVTDRVILVCSGVGDDSATSPAALPEVARRLVVSTHAEIVAIGSPDWVADHWDEIRTRLDEPTSPASWDDDELDDED